MSTPGDLFDQLSELGFKNRLRYDVSLYGETSCTTRQQTICDYVSAFTYNGHVLVLAGSVYVIGTEPYVSATILRTGGIRNINIGIPKQVTGLTADHIKLIGLTCAEIKRLPVAPPEMKVDDAFYASVSRGGELSGAVGAK